MSLIIHDVTLIIHDMSLITHDMSLIIHDIYDISWFREIPRISKEGSEIPRGPE